MQNLKESPKHIWALLGLCLPVMVACIDLMAVSLALSKIMHTFSSPMYKLQWLISGYNIGIAAFLITIGRIADIYGRRKVLLFGVLMFALTSISAAVSTSILLLVFSRFLQGVASAMMMTTVVAIITHTFPSNTRDKAVSIWASSLGLGMALGPLVGALVIHITTWRWIFLANVPIALISYVLIKLFVKESKNSDSRQKVNWLDTLLLSSILIFITCWIPAYNSQGWNSPEKLATFFVFAALIGDFFLVQKHRTNPLIDFSLFKEKKFLGANICGLISYGCMYGWLFIFNIYLQHVLGMSPVQSGLTFIAFSLGFAINANFVGKAMKQWNKKVIMQLGFIIIAATSLWMSTIATNYSLVRLIIMFFLFGAGIIAVNTTSVAIIVESVSKQKAGIASGMMFTFRWLGGSIGVILVMMLFQHSIGENSSVYTRYPSGLYSVCLFLAGLSVFGFICSILLLNNKQRFWSKKVKSKSSIGSK